MTVAELIAALQKMPQDAPVIYINECADDGSQCVNVDFVETQSRQNWLRAPSGMPIACVVLS